MSYLLDTNVISELRKPKDRADAKVRAWIASRTASDLFLSVITILEIEIGTNQTTRRDEAQARHLQTWLDDTVLDAFAGRILAVDTAVARRCARMHVPGPST